MRLGEVLDGDHMEKSLNKFKFRENVDQTNHCSLSLEKDDIEKLEEAIEDQYYFKFVVDDIPIRNFSKCWLV